MVLAARRCGGWARACFLLLAAAIVTGSPSVRAQVGELSGVVLDDLTGQPIGRALVSSPDGRVAQMTSANGQFHIASGTASDNLELRARRPGYLPLEHGAKLASGQSRLELRLRPEAVLTGQVQLSDGTPGRQVRVVVEERHVEDGRALWTQRGGANVNFEGDYRVAGLAPGQYRVQTREWSDEPSAPTETPQLGYPPVRSEPITLAEGQHLQQDLQLEAEPYLPIEVPVANCDNDGISVEAQNSSGLDFELGAEDGVIKGSLPRGTYALRVSCFGNEARVGEVSLTVADTALRTPPVTIPAGAVVPIEVRQQFTATTNAGAPTRQLSSGLGSGNSSQFRGRRLAEVMLQPVEGPARLGEVGHLRPGPQGGSELVGVGPGRYWVHVMPREGYVASAIAGGVDLRRDPLVIASGGAAVPLSIDLRDDTGSVSGSAPAGLAEVRLLPVDNGMARERDVPLAADGTFSATGLAPGRWLLLGSSADRLPIEFRSPEIEHQWETRGSVVDIPAGGQASVTLPSSPAASPALQSAATGSEVAP